jgi:hypothetical protein
MRIGVRRLLAIALIAAAGSQIGCGGSDEESSNQELQQVQIESLAAYACMPEARRAELRRLERQHNARIRALAEQSPQGATGPAFRRTVESDPARRRVLAKARAIYRLYLPGGKKYDAACFFREREKAKTRVTGS